MSWPSSARKTAARTPSDLAALPELSAPHLLRSSMQEVSVVVAEAWHRRRLQDENQNAEEAEEEQRKSREKESRGEISDFRQSILLLYESSQRKPG